MASYDGPMGIFDDYEGCSELNRTPPKPLDYDLLFEHFIRTRHPKHLIKKLAEHADKMVAIHDDPVKMKPSETNTEVRNEWARVAELMREAYKQIDY